MFKFIIFDLDGVFVRASWEGLFEAYKAIFLVENKDWKKFFKNIEEFKKWWNPNWPENLGKIGITDYKKSNKIFYEVVKPYFYLMNWVDSFLDKASKDYEIAIFTNREKSSALEDLDPIAHYFCMIVTADDVTKLKPHPEGVELILKKMKFRAKDTLMIGDRPEDLLAGRAAGTKTGAVIWVHGMGLDEDFAVLDFKPDFVFRTVEDFLEKL